MQAIDELRGLWMWNFLNQTPVQAALSLLTLLVLCIVGYVVLVRLRDSSRKRGQSLADVLGNFEEMRREGDISESEFRTIEAVLGKKAASVKTDFSKPESTN